MSVALGLIAIAAFVTVLTRFTLRMTAPLASAADAFMQALKDKHYAQAFMMLTRSMQAQIGSQKDMAKLFAAQDAVPDQWWLSSRRLHFGGRTGRIRGRVRLTNGSHHRLVLYLEASDSTWLIASFSIR